MSRLLEGLRVLEVATWIAVPACGALLADLGAGRRAVPRLLERRHH